MGADAWRVAEFWTSSEVKTFLFGDFVDGLADWCVSKSVAKYDSVRGGAASRECLSINEAIACRFDAGPSDHPL